MDSPVHDTIAFSPSVRNAFIQYIQDTPNNRRISQAEKSTIVEWLTDPTSRSTSQQQSSRRNYIRKRFVWDSAHNGLFALGKERENERKEVVTLDRIVDVVESVHVDNGHGGWDATWSDTARSYYGILRADVIFLVKRCTVCAQNPRKRPKKEPYLEHTQASPEPGEDPDSETPRPKDCLWDEFLNEAPTA